MLFAQVLLLGSFLCGSRGQVPELWIIDTDAGADDGVAISFFLGTEELKKTVKLHALSAVAGNTNADNVAINLLKILKTANRLDIPVYKGANQSILITPPGDNFFGQDGFGDFPFPDAPTEDLIQPEHAVNFLVEAVNQNPGKLNILAIGPLTNLALAIRMDPTFLQKAGKIVILGGSVEGRGNSKPGVEFNFFIDPEAVFIVFDEAKRLGKILQIFSWEASLSIGISLDWRRDVLGAIDSPLIKILNQAEATSLNTTEGSWISADTFATMYAILPEFPNEDELLTGYMETCGSFTRGTSVIDYMHDAKGTEQLKIVKAGSTNTTFITESLVQLFTEFVPGRSKKCDSS